MFSHGKVDWTASCFLVNKIVSPPPCTDAKRELEIWGHPLYRWNMQSSSIWRLPYNNCCSIDGAPLLGDSTKICLLNAAGRKCDWSLFAQLCTTVSVQCAPQLVCRHICKICKHTGLSVNKNNSMMRKTEALIPNFNHFALVWSHYCHI